MSDIRVNSQKDVLTLCLRLCLEPSDSHSPDTLDVLDRYRPAWEAAAGGMDPDQALALLPKSNGPADPDYAVPSIEDLRELVKLPADNQTHIENLEKAYGEARRIIMKLLPSRSASEAGADDARDAARYRFLRECTGPVCAGIAESDPTQWLDSTDLDAAVDAARYATDRREG